MVTIEVYWDDLTKAKQEEIRESLGMEPDDNGNWDVFPITTMGFEVNEDEE